MKRMKKILSVLLVAVMMSQCVFALVSCDEETVCQHTEWGEWTITTEATCVEAGERTRTCKGCTQTEVEKIAALSHSFSKYVSDNNGTCIANATETAVCDRCDVTDTREVADSKNPSVHTSEEIHYHKNATDSNKHDKQYACCGAVIEAQPHTWDNGVADGDVTVYTCTLCKTTNRVAPAGHTHNAIFTSGNAASCTEAGNPPYWHCEGCNTYFSDEALTQQLSVSEIVIPATHISAEFIYTVNLDDATKHDKKHACCGAIIETVAHDFQFHQNLIAKCDQAGGEEHKCVCGETKLENETPASGHNVEFWNFEGETPKTGAECTFVQTYNGICFTCNKAQTMTHEVVRHRFVATVTAHPTCSSTGSKSYRCECGAVPEISTVVIPKVTNAHDWSDGVTEGGVTTYTCNECSASKTAVVSSTSDISVAAGDLANNELVLDTVSLSLDSTTLGLLTGQVNVSATPVANRDALINTIPEALRGHITANTPIYDFSLSSNGQEINDFGGGSITITMPYTLPEGADADCVAMWYIDSNGKVSFYRATYYEVNGSGFVSFEAEHFSTYLPGLAPEEDACTLYGHNDVISTVAPTCTESGYTEYHCQRCGNSRMADTVSPLGHAYDSGVSTDATCSVPGTTTYTCTRSGCTHSMSVALIVPHDYRYNETASHPASCTEDGYAIYSCYNCIAQKREEQKAYGGHEMEIVGVALVDGASSCLDGVVLSKRCYICTATDTEIIYAHTPYDKYGYSDESTPLIAETYIKLGSYLTQMGISYTEEPVITLMHGCLCGEKKSDITMSNGMNMYGNEVFMGWFEGFHWHSAPQTPGDCDTVLMQTYSEGVWDPMLGQIVTPPVFKLQFKEILTVDGCHYTYSVEIKIGYNEDTGEALLTETYVLYEFDFHIEQTTATVKDPSKSCYENCFDENKQFIYGITVTVTCKSCGEVLRTYEDAVSSSSAHFWYSTGEVYEYADEDCRDGYYGLRVTIQACPCGMEKYTVSNRADCSFTSQTVDGATVYTCRDCGYIYAEKTVDLDDRENCHRTRTHYLWLGCESVDNFTACEKTYTCVSINEVAHYSTNQVTTTEETDYPCCVYKHVNTVCGACGEVIRSSSYYDKQHDIRRTETVDSHGNSTVTESCNTVGCEYLHIVVTNEHGQMLREYTEDKDYTRGEKSVVLYTWKVIWDTLRPMIERTEYYDLESGVLLRWYQTNYTYEILPQKGCIAKSTYINHSGEGGYSNSTICCEFGEEEYQMKTCTQDGYTRRTCMHCGYVEYLWYEEAGHYFSYEYTYKEGGEYIPYQRCTMCGVIVRDEYASRPLDVMCWNSGGDAMTVNYQNPEGSTSVGIDASVSFVAYAINEWNELVVDKDTFEIITLTLSGIDISDDGNGTLSFAISDVMDALGDAMENQELQYAVCVLIEADGQAPIYIHIR